MNFRFTVDTDKLASVFNTDIPKLKARLTEEVGKLSISTHAFIVDKANNELKGYMKDTFLGPNNTNVRWVQVSDSIWVVEIDESVKWIEEGRPATSMATPEWLLKPGKAKVAKDGSLYRVIPFTNSKLAGPKAGSSDPKAAYEAIVNNAIKAQGLNLRKIERNSDGSPKLGILHHVDVQPPGTRKQFPDLFSKPRSKEMAAITGLQPHDGIFKLQNTVITQRLSPKGKPIREAVTFRVVSSKHQLENRWMYPEVKPFNSIEAGYQYAEQQWAKILQTLDSELGKIG